jgi:hypothetical protein
LSRRGRSLPGNAGGFDTQCDSITIRLAQVETTAAAAAGSGTSGLDGGAQTIHVAPTVVQVSLSPPTQPAQQQRWQQEHVLEEIAEPTGAPMQKRPVPMADGGMMAKRRCMNAERGLHEASGEGTDVHGGAEVADSAATQRPPRAMFSGQAIAFLTHHYSEVSSNPTAEQIKQLLQ